MHCFPYPYTFIMQDRVTLEKKVRQFRLILLVTAGVDAILGSYSEEYFWNIEQYGFTMFYSDKSLATAFKMRFIIMYNISVSG